MTRKLLALALAPVCAVPAFAGEVAPPSNGIVYTVTARGGSGLTGNCTIVADRWTADYGPTTVYAVGVSPSGAVWTRIRCTVTKSGTTWVDTERTEHGGLVVVDGERDSTIPVAGITVCAEVESQLMVDLRPHAKNCIAG